MSSRLEFFKSSIEAFLNKDVGAPDDFRMKDLLEEMEGVYVTAPQLKATELGVLVNRIAKLGNNELTLAAKKVVSAWRQCVQKRDSEMKPPTKKIKSDSPIDSAPASPTSADNDIFSSLKIITVKEKLCDPNDSVRKKCVEMLTQAFLVDQVPQKFKETNAKYKEKFRSRYFNLKDKNNPTLRCNILSGEISAERFSAMNAAEMANDSRKKENEALHLENISKAQVAANTQGETDQFKCGRCQKRRTTYYQLQTRSADEPMTTFVTCLNCNNRWKSKGTTIKDALKLWEEKTNQKANEAKIVKLMNVIPFIIRMDSSLAVLTAVEHLSLSTNQIEKISNLNENLKILSLGRNNIKKLEGLDAVADTLEELWISYNQIERLNGIECCKKLKTVYASNNKIKAWDGLDRLKELPCLEDILLIGNPLEEKATADGVWRDEVSKRFPVLKKLDGKPIIRDDDVKDD